MLGLPRPWVFMRSGSDDADGKFKTSCEISKGVGGIAFVCLFCCLSRTEEERTAGVSKPPCFHEWEPSLEAEHLACIIIIQL